MSLQLIEKYHSEVEKLRKYGGSTNESTVKVAFRSLINSYAQ
jgi:hypothetical protein